MKKININTYSDLNDLENQIDEEENR